MSLQTLGANSFVQHHSVAGDSPSMDPHFAHLYNNSNRESARTIERRLRLGTLLDLICGIGEALLLLTLLNDPY